MKCQFQPCENDAMVTISDDYMAWRVCADHAEEMFPRGWKPMNVERDPDRPGWLREERVH